MEVPGGKNFKASVLMAEFLGTTCLLYAINLSGGNPVAIGITIAAQIFTYGPISGGHFNPAVTAGVFMREVVAGRGDLGMFGFCILHFIFEFAGAVFGCFLVWLCNDSAYKNTAYLNVPNEKFVSTFNVFLIEMWVTFFFVSVILGIKYQNEARDLITNALMIGITLAANIMVAAGTTGASLNPAVSGVQILFQT